MTINTSAFTAVLSLAVCFVFQAVTSRGAGGGGAAAGLSRTCRVGVLQVPGGHSLATAGWPPRFSMSNTVTFAALSITAFHSTTFGLLQKRTNRVTEEEIKSSLNVT